MNKNNYALLIGINYIGTSIQLNGCHNDVIKMKEILKIHYNYNDENIIILIDKEGYIQPTKLNIQEQLKILHTKSQNNTINELYIHYSGHGSNIIQSNKSNNTNNCIIPLDYNNSGTITNKYIYSFLSKIKHTKKITLIFDSCNSAFCSNLPYYFTLIDTNTKQLIKQTLDYTSSIKNNKSIYVLSGCLNNKVSYDVKETDGTPCGLLTYNLIKTLKQFNYTCTIYQLLINIKIGFGTNDQTPIISVNNYDCDNNTIIFEKSVHSSFIKLF